MLSIINRYIQLKQSLFLLFLFFFCILTESKKVTHYDVEYKNIIKQKLCKVKWIINYYSKTSLSDSRDQTFFDNLSKVGIFGKKKRLKYLCQLLQDLGTKARQKINTFMHLNKREIIHKNNKTFYCYILFSSNYLDAFK